MLKDYLVRAVLSTETETLQYVTLGFSAVYALIVTVYDVSGAVLQRNACYADFSEP